MRRPRLSLSVASVLAGLFATSCQSNDGAPAAAAPDPTKAESYPLLMRYFGLSQADVDRTLQNVPLAVAAGTPDAPIRPTSRGTPITRTGIKNMVIGAIVSRTDGEFVNRPIFRMGALRQAGLLLEDAQSSFTQEDSIELKATNRGDSNSWQFKESFSASASGAIGFRAQVAESVEEKGQYVKTSGDIGITFRRVSYSPSAPSLRISTGTFSGNTDFSKFLIGTPLKPDELASMLVTTTCGAAGEEPFACVRVFDRDLKNHESRVYERVQLLGALEDAFGRYAAEYRRREAISAADPELARLRKALVLLRADIRERIDDFYSDFGQAFVSELYTMGDAVATGTLRFGAENGTSENRWGFSLGASYSNFLYGGGGQFEYGRMTQSGWSSSFKNMSITATSNPTGFADVGAWSTTIASMLQNEAVSIAVPTADLKAPAPTVQLPPVVPPKEPMLPPEGTFSNFEEWKQVRDYLRDPKAAEDAKKKSEEDLTQSLFETIIERRGTLTMPEPTDLAAALRAEIAMLEGVQGREYKPMALSAEEGSNAVNVTGHFVSGFRTMGYDEVIRQLRPNLDIPGDGQREAELFSNATQLRMLVDRVGDATAYVNFLNKIEPVSGVTASMSAAFERFGTAFRNDALALIRQSTLAGRDVPDDVLTDFVATYLGKKGSDGAGTKLYAELGSIDAYRFFRAGILVPEAAKLWAEASGGLVPLTFRNKNDRPGLTLFDVQGIGYDAGKPFLSSRNEDRYARPEDNVLDLYTYVPGLRETAPQTPWYPVYRFNGAKEPSLFFVQFAGPNLIVYGRQWVVVPVAANPPTNGALSPDFKKSDPVNAFARLSETMLERIADPANSFLFTCENTRSTTPTMKNQPYSVHFANSTPSRESYERNRVVLLAFSKLCLPAIANPYPDAEGGFRAIHAPTAYAKFRVEDMASLQPDPNTANRSAPFLLDANLRVVSTCTAGLPCLDTTSPMRIVLMPINSRSAPANFGRLFRWGSNRALGDLVRTGDYADFNAIRYIH